MKKKFFVGMIYIAMFLLLAGLVLLKGYTVITYETPKEFREMNTVIFAYNFANGTNLYSYSVLGREVPAATSMYGFLVPLLMSPFVRLFSFTSLNALQICEMLTVFVEVIGLILFYKLLYGRTANHLICLLGTILFYGCFWRLTASGGAFPDQWGMVLALLLMHAVLKDEKKGKYRPLLYAVIVILSFYIKQYFVFCVLGLIGYCFIHSKKDVIKLGVYGAIAGGISVALVHRIFPLYFIETFPMAQGQTSSNDLGYSLKQIITISWKYYPIVSIITVIGIVVLICNAYKNKDMKSLFSYEFCQILFVLVPLVYIAQNRGAIYTYYLQIWYPYVIFLGMIILNRLFDIIRTKKSERVFSSILCNMLVCVLIVISIFSEWTLVRCRMMSKSELTEWREAYSILDKYSDEGDILVPPHLSLYCLENGIETSEYGQAEFNSTGNLSHFQSSSIWPHIFSDGGVLLQKNISYNQQIREKINENQYSCIALTIMGSYWLTAADLEAAGYELLTSKTLVTGKQQWKTEFWVLK